MSDPVPPPSSSSAPPSTNHPYQTHEHDPRSTSLPDISVSAPQGSFLRLQAQLISVRHILEISTLGVYSTIWLASSSLSVRVTSIEIDPKHADIAKAAVKDAGMEDQVEVLLGVGREVLPRLQREVEEGKRQRWDFVFVDADKRNNLWYFERAVEMCRGNALVIVDNVVRKGDVAREELVGKDEGVEGSRNVIEGVGRDGRVDGTVLQTVGGEEL